MPRWIGALKGMKMMEAEMLCLLEHPGYPSILSAVKNADTQD